MILRALGGLLLLPLLPLILLDALWRREGAWRLKRIAKRGDRARRRLRAWRADRGP